MGKGQVPRTTSKPSQWNAPPVSETDGASSIAPAWSAALMPIAVKKLVMPILFIAPSIIPDRLVLATFISVSTVHLF